MKYYSTNNESQKVSLAQAVAEGLAQDGGLFMPENIPLLPQSFYDNIENLSIQQIAFEVATALFGDDVPRDALKTIVYESMNFDIPLVEVEKGIYALELFHGNTLAFKDVGARFMSRMLSYFIQNNRWSKTDDVNVLVATSGDTGSAVANGFLGVEGINVFVLYPKGKVSKIQECQFATLGQNITALEVNGSFDDCQALVKSAFCDSDLKQKLCITSANSINVARFLPQTFYYFYAYSQLKKISAHAAQNFTICVPSGNFGNLTAGLFAKKMGLPVKHFIAANNRNDVFFDYLKTGKYVPRPSVVTLANAMDVGAPSNFARILELYGNAYDRISAEISGASFDDEQIAETILNCYHSNRYLLDPHGACAYQALKNTLRNGEIGIFLETAHPAKFIDTVEKIIGDKITIPARLQEFTKGIKQSIQLENNYLEFRNLLFRGIKS
jgi:threonine synthase